MDYSATEMACFEFNKAVSDLPWRLTGGVPFTVARGVHSPHNPLNSLQAVGLPCSHSASNWMQIGELQGAWAWTVVECMKTPIPSSNAATAVALETIFINIPSRWFITPMLF
jgi:hypothetical protein